MKKYKISEESGKGFYDIFYSTDFEYVDPLRHYAEDYIRMSSSMMGEIFALKETQNACKQN